MSEARRKRVMRTMAARAAVELGRHPDDVMRDLQEAIDAGLLRVTRNGLQATLPPDGTDVVE